MSRRPDLDGLDEEIREHLDAETAELIARGLPPIEARAAALRKFGNPLRVKEDVREVWIPRWFDQLRQDGRDAVRQVRRHAGFSVAVVVTLALGIGLTTAIYSVVHAVLIRPLAYPHPDRMVWLTTFNERSKGEVLNDVDFGDWRAAAQSFEHLVAYNQSDMTLVAAGEATRARVVSATGGFWAMTGATAALGALPTGDDPSAVAVSARYFRERFGSDPSVVGRAVTLDGRAATITAVLPADYAPQLPGTVWRPGVERMAPDLYRPLVLGPPNRANGPNAMVRIVQGVGQLKAGIGIDQARAELELLHERQQQAAPMWFGRSTPRVMPLAEKLVGGSRFALTLLLGAAGLVLLITCANVAGLLLSRTATRQKEIALRMSVGSGPRRVIRQLLAESVVFALLGGAAGIALAAWLVRMVVSVIGPAVPRLSETSFDPAVLGFVAGVSVLTALLFGVGPAVALSRTNVHDVLKEGARTASASRTRRLAGRAMVMTQLALTVVLLVGAALMLKSVWRLTAHPPGFEPNRLLTLRVEFSGPQYRDTAARQAYVERMLAAARARPGVAGAAVTSGGEGTMLVREEHDPIPEIMAGRTAGFEIISAALPRLMGMSLVRGRLFADAEPEPVLLVNEALARQNFAGRDPIGRRIRLPFAGPHTLGTIVGVVSDARYSQLDEAVPPQAFFHYASQRMFGVTLVVRVEGDPLEAAAGIRTAMAALDPTQSVFSVRTVEQSLAESIAPRRFNLLLLSIFAGVALVLAMLGVYGVVAHAVAERTHEIGIRLALGAERRGVVGMIVRQGMTNVLVGVALGTAGATAAGRLMTGLLWGVEATDVPTFALATTALVTTAFIACSAPALRAALVDPVVALRQE